MSTPLVIVAHPQLTQSRINAAWMAALRQVPSVTVHDLYARYPDEVIDVQAEQQQLAAHDRIILQFPFQWYNCPPLLKKWLDLVLEHGWAYGPGTVALHGKQLGIAVSTWSRATDYQKDDRYGRTMEELTSPFEVTALRISMHYLPGFFLNGVGEIDDQQLATNAEAYCAYVQQEAF
ncbi:MAG: NAD(P)H-dependent oxidoreductase [Neisseriaceae bacterium]|nr:NAD(P)H-dependent oxidoreductase [Neisseriaceae bacterium]MBP6862275.1 NAD(P)H-dependent oxidoreductase [Neisseriaceae bacterium]